MVMVSGRSGWRDIREQFMTLKVMAGNIKSQEQFLQMIDHQDVIPDMARRLSKDAISGDLLSNKRVLLDFLYNIISRTDENSPQIDIEFFFILIEKEFFQVDRCVIWLEHQELNIPFEIGEKFGRAILGEEKSDAVKKVMAVYKEYEAKFDREHFGDLNRCSLVILEELYPRSSWHIQMRLPVEILNDYSISI
jgi:hypothetical protein